MSDGAAEPLAPRETATLFGHDAAERVLVDAARSGRLPHAWLIIGPRGIGKATLAYRFARSMLVGEAMSAGLFADTRSDTLHVAPDHPVFRRVAAGGHADLFTLERTRDERTGKRRGEIVVKDARALGAFLRLTPAEGGWRVAIVDSADELNRNSANAILKILEEPPDKALLILVSHAPNRLLPTVRSRCRRLALKPLSEDDLARVLGAHLDTPPSAEDLVALTRLSDGSAGRAFALLTAGGLDLYRDMIALLATLPALDIAAAHRFCDRFTGDTAAESAALARALLIRWLARLIREVSTGTAGTAPETVPGEAAALARTAAGLGDPRRASALWDGVSALFRHADAARLEPRAVLLDAFLAIERGARGGNAT